MLTIAFPFFHGDRDRALTLAHQINTLGAGQNQHCLIVCPQGTKRDDIEGVLRSAFHSVDVHEYAAQLEGWPQGPNEAFQEGTMRIAMDPKCGDFFWIETDVLLTQARAFDIAEAAFRNCGQSLMGNVVDTVRMDTRQKVGRHMIGVGFYPKEFAKHCPLVKFIVRMSAEHVRQDSMPMAFDAYLGAYTAGRCSETNLLQHFWRSSKFHVEQGVIVAGETVSPEKRVRPDALFIHGCKDDSLFKLLTLGETVSAKRIGKPDVAIAEIAVEKSGYTEKPTVTISTEIAPKPSEPVKMSTMEPPRTGHTNLDWRKGKKFLPYPPEAWNYGEDGRPCPPFMLGQAEFKRWNQLMNGRLQKDGLKKLKDYAKMNLKLRPGLIKAEALIDLCVLAERAAGTMEWTQTLPPPWFPPMAEPIPPTETVAPVQQPAPPSPAGWSAQPPEKVIEGSSEISDLMKQKMLQLRIKRGEIKAPEMAAT